MAAHRSAGTAAWLVGLGTLVGCAPTLNVLGVYFPAWLVSATVGLVAAYALVWLLARQALVASMAAASRTLRGDPPGVDSGLGEAHRAVETQLDELRGRQDLARARGTRGTDDLLAQVDSRRQLAACQLAIEAWLADWRRAAGSY